MKEPTPSQPLTETPPIQPSAEVVFTPRKTPQEALPEKLKELDAISRNNSASIAREKFQHLQETTKETNYFFQARLEQFLKKPLEDWGPTRKRSFIKNNWSITFNILNIPTLSEKTDFPQEILVCWLEDASPETLSEQAIEYLFNAWRETEPEYFTWLEQREFHNHYQQNHLLRQYNIKPLATTSLPKNKEDEFTRDSTYSRISREYAVIYDPTGKIDSFFKLNPETETGQKKQEHDSGPIKLSSLSFFINLFKSALEEEDTAALFRYIQIREQLPHALVDQWESTYHIEFPDELKKAYQSLDEFEQELQPFSEAMAVQWTKLPWKDAFHNLISSLETLVEERRTQSAEKNFGYAGESTEVFEFFNSFIDNQIDRMTSWDKHYSLLYYLFIRKELPKELVKEFETRFLVHIPKHLESFPTLDHYIATDSQELESVFSNTPDITEATKWLHEKLDALNQRIQAQKVTPKRYSLKDIVIEEGLDPNAIDEDSLDALLSNYSAILTPNLRSKIEEELHIHLNQLDIRTQLQLLDFLSRADTETVHQIEWFLSGGFDPLSPEEARERLLSFLALEDPTIDFQDIVNMESWLGDTLSKELFRKYAEIHDTATQVFQRISDQFPKTTENAATYRAIKNKLFDKAKELIVHYIEKAKIAKATQRNSDIIYTGDIMNQKQALSKEIKSIQTEIDFFRIAFKELYLDGAIKDFSEISGVEFATGTSSELELSEQDINAMRTMYLNNYPDSDYSREFRETILSSFDQAIQQPNTVLYTLKKDNEIVAFLRFDHLDDGSLYFGSFNVHPKFSGTKIGEALYKTAFETEQKAYPEAPIKASCDPRRPVSSFYMRTGGFIGTSTTRIGGVQLLNIRLDPKKQFASKAVSLTVLRGREFSDTIVIPPITKNPDFHLLDEGYVLTHYYIKENSDTLSVFEKDPKAHSEGISPTDKA